MLGTCSYLYGNKRYRPISELVTSHYLVLVDQFSLPPGIKNPDKAKLFCYGLGNFYATRKEYGEAIKSYEKAIELKPDYAAAWNNKGSALGDLGRYEEAIACLDKAIEIEPNYAAAWYNRACYKVRNGDTENALADLKNAVEIDKANMELAKQEKDFESIRNDERFKDLVG
jgi:tetratricopeptide (TPR) repeat protein